MVRSTGKFAAVEVKADETPNQAIGSLMHLMNSQGVGFGALELFETFKINRTRFARIRTDLDVKLNKEAILASGRGVIVAHDTAIRYEVILADGPRGNYSATSMHATARMTEYKSYRGTRDKFWTRQF